ncbi:response regulator [Variovorax sp. J22P168]|uniref:response regulator n=1 Tax=Variovorax jilinensis TaxID=3053513 RepID=UPI0025770D87|nr:response regulator [Variovorax sp. J22P168]MDM0014812.1 response regulator [Variovorax sp. J22P168]
MSKILVIEEDAAMRVLISEWLAGEGHHVHSLPRYEPALCATADLVILDFPHPRSRDLESKRTVQAVHAAYPKASVIGISTRLGRSLGSKSDAARALGVDRLLAKPCTRDELVGSVATMLQSHEIR